MSSAGEETGETSPSAETVGSADDGSSEFDEEASTVSLVPNPRVVPYLNLAAREGKECVRRKLEEIEAGVGILADSRAEEASERDSFVDIMGSLERHTGCASERFTFADILRRADLLSETLLGFSSLPLICHRVCLHSSVPLAFLLYEKHSGHHHFSLVSLQRALIRENGIMGLLCFIF